MIGAQIRRHLKEPCRGAPSLLLCYCKPVRSNGYTLPWIRRFTEAYTVQGRLRGDLMPTPNHPLKLMVDGELMDYRRVMFSTRCDHYRYYPARQEVFKHDHHDQHWEKIADVEVHVDEQTGEILRSRVKMLPGKDW